MDTLYRYLRPYWRYAVLALVLAAINQVFSLLDPAILQHIIDNYATKRDAFTRAEFIRGVATLLGMAVGVAFISRVAKNFQDYFVNVITQRVGADLYSDGIRHSLALPFQTFEDQRSGETLGKLQKVRTDTERFIGQFVNFVFVTIVGVVFVMIYSFRIHWSIAPAFLLTVPILTFVSSALSKRVKTIQKVIVKETTALAGATTESLRNIELVKSLGLAKQEELRLNATTDKILQLELKKVRYIRSISFVQGTTVNFIRTCVLFLLLYLIYQHQVSVGQYVSLLIYSFFIFGPMQELGNVVNTFRETEASLATFDDIFKIPIDPKPANPIAVDDLQDLEFSGVSFTHATANTPALADVSFNAHRGQTLAFVGPSGSGKTTLVKLLVGLYRPSHGSILYNGISSQDVDLDKFREHIGFVTQDAQLFSGTIRENLLFVHPGATDEQCLDVLRRAAATSRCSIAPTTGSTPSSAKVE